MNETLSTALATISPEVAQELRIVTQAIEVSLGVRELTVDFKQRRYDLLGAADMFVAPPENDDEQEKIKTAQRALAALRIEVNKQSDALKGPLNTARKKIIDLTDSGVSMIEKAEKRLEGFIQHRQQLLIRQQQERKKIEDAAREAKEALEAAETQRLAAEYAAKQAEAMKGREKQQAEAKAAQMAADAQRAAEDAFERALAAESSPAPEAAPVSELPMSREVYDFEIVGNRPDEKAKNLIALAYEYPELFTAHFKDESPRGYSLSLKIMDVTDKLNGKLPAFGCVPPGLKIITKLTKLR